MNRWRIEALLLLYIHSLLRHVCGLLGGFGFSDSESNHGNPSKYIAECLQGLLSGGSVPLSKYPPAEPGALVLEPLKAACPCCSSSFLLKV
jgi:hypothetical protein